MNETTLRMFETLTELPGTSGFEDQIRAFMHTNILESTTEIVQDYLGSLFGVLTGEATGPKIMVNGHMDEVGFMITSITDKGFLKFQPIGGWWNQVLLAQRVEIYTAQGSIVGVIGSTPPHLLHESQRNQPIDIKNMYIDIGADNPEQVHQLGIRPGTPAVPICPFTPMENKKIMAKAWDNRFGVGLALELLQHFKQNKHPNILYAGATVQEEVGLRGAQTASALIEPDLCYTLDAGPANDTSGDPHAFGQLGKGTLLRIMDGALIPNQRLIEFILDTAETNQIPYQYFVSPGATDAGKVHLYGKGVPTAALGICARYIHTSASIIHTDDYEASKQLLIELIKSSDRSTVDTIRSFV